MKKEFIIIFVTLLFLLKTSLMSYLFSEIVHEYVSTIDELKIVGRIYRNISPTKEYYSYDFNYYFFSDDSPNNCQDEETFLHGCSKEQAIILVEQYLKDFTVEYLNPRKNKFFK